MLLKRSFRTPLLLLAAMLMASGCAKLTDQFANLPKLQDEALRFRPVQSSFIYDGNNRIITTVHGVENRSVVKLRKIPEHVREAVISIEDERFFEHDGVDVRAVMRAMLENASAGGIKQGGSTITQQYVKNVIIAPEGSAARTLRRKIVEASLARQLEQRLSEQEGSPLGGKKEILERYLNTVYFGGGAYGIQAAARTYFGRSVADMNVAQGALLAGLIRAPEDYDPFDQPRAARARRNVVLDKMHSLGVITDAQHARSIKKGLGIQTEVKADDYPAAYFVDYVRRLIKFDPRFNDLAPSPNEREQLLLNGGLNVYTTIDLDMQQKAEDAVNGILTESRDPYGSLMAIDPDNGHIKAMVGGRNFFDRKVKKDEPGKVNLAVQGEPNLGPKRDGKKAPGTGRQAGSSFKTFALAAAITDGVSLAKKFEGSGPKTFPGADSGADWKVNNYEGGAFGKISLLEGTVKSVNTVYAQLILDVGPEAVVDLATEMGISTEVPPVPSAVLGSGEVNPLGMASGYSTLAAGGKRHDPVAITRIVDSKGKVRYEDETEEEEVMPPAVAYLTTSALEAVVDRGTGTHAQIGDGRAVAGKTGTAQEYRDAWFGGYTPDLAAAVWVGHPHGQVEMQPCSVTHRRGAEICRAPRIGQVTGGSWPAEIWQRFMSAALEGVPPSDFPKPGGIVVVTVDTRNGCLAGAFTPSDSRARAEFAAGTEPTKTCREPGDRIKVRDVVGLPLVDARRLLEDQGFSVSVERTPTAAIPPGRVMSQSPSGRARPGSTISLVVSARKEPEEPETTEVPSTLGMSRSDSEETLKDEGFNVQVIIQSESNKKKAKKRAGRVWKQSPGGGSEAEEGSTVTIWVNPE